MYIPQTRKRKRGQTPEEATRRDSRNLSSAFSIGSAPTGNRLSRGPREKRSKVKPFTAHARAIVFKTGFKIEPHNTRALQQCVAAKGNEITFSCQAKNSQLHSYPQLSAESWLTKCSSICDPASKAIARPRPIDRKPRLRLGPPAPAPAPASSSNGKSAPSALAARSVGRFRSRESGIKREREARKKVKGREEGQIRSAGES